MDADERRAAALKDPKGLPPSRKSRTLGAGPLGLDDVEWKILIAITVLASFVRLYRISSPASVV